MELCGWGHYRMTATMRCVSNGEFESWKVSQFNKQQQ
jgi:heme/copper-type cytochrome/quinol oxidase subunit 2